MLRQGVHRMSQIETEHIDEVFEETCRHLKKANIFTEGSTDYLQRVITKAMGPEKAGTILSRIFTEESDESYGIEALHEMDAKTLALFLKDEHPQTVAFILAHLYPPHAGEVFTLLPEDKQPDTNAFRGSATRRPGPSKKSARCATKSASCKPAGRRYASGGGNSQLCRQRHGRESREITISSRN